VLSSLSPRWNFPRYKDFWESGAFVDIAGATNDPDAFELERRTIQSLYLMRSQEAGSVPPQESALLYNSWTGKHHSEMRWVGVCFVACLHVFFLVLFDTSASLGCVW
jgi:hypothetical protein